FFTHSGQVVADGWLACFGRGLDSLYSLQLEYDRLAHRAATVWCIFNVMAAAYHWALVAQASLDASEKQEVFAIFHMRRDAAVTTLKRHISELSFAEILEGSVFPKAVGVTMVKTFLTSDDNHQRMSSRRDDASLSLPSKTVMNVGAAFVNASPLKTPIVHCPSCLFSIVTGFMAESKTGAAFNFPPSEGTGAGRHAQEIPNISFRDGEAEQ